MLISNFIEDAHTRNTKQQRKKNGYKERGSLNKTGFTVYISILIITLSPPRLYHTQYIHVFLFQTLS